MDKVKLIRHEIEKRRVHNLAIGNPLFAAMAEEDIELLSFIDFLQEEPVSEDLEKVVEEIVEPTILNAYGTKELAKRLRNTICGTSVSEDLEEAIDTYLKSYWGGEKEKQDWPFLKKMAIYFAEWQKQKDSIPVSEELEKAAEEYIEYTPRYDIGYELEEGNDPTEIDCFTIDEAIAAFIVGANWQKEQLTKEAIDGVITFDYYGDDDKTYGCIAHDSFCLEDFGLKDTDKVKMILIKED